MIKIDYSRDETLPEFSIKTVEDRYLTEGETSPQDAFARAAATFSDDEEMITQVKCGLCFPHQFCQMGELVEDYR